jgi:16S rRNA (guanine527-N7)-methyltransferase
VDSTEALKVELARALASLALPVPAAAVEGLGRYYALLLRWQGRVRLVGRTDPATVAVVHLADALTVLPFLAHLPAGARVVDIGTGAGLPGIPLALARRDLAFDLVEPDHRKAAFVKAAVAGLGLGSVRVHARKAEGEPAGEGIPQGALVVSRAFRAPETWLPLARAYVEAGGRVVAMMAAQAPAEEAGLETLGTPWGLRLAQTWRGTLPGDAGARVVAAWTAPSAAAG